MEKIDSIVRTRTGKICKIHPPAFLHMLWLVFMLITHFGASAQCGCPEYALTRASFNTNTVLPFCDELAVNTEISNTIGNNCPADVILRISFGAATESPGYENLLSFNYLGNLPLYTEDFWTDGQVQYRRFAFKVSDIPAKESISNLLRFTLTPQTYAIDPIYLTVVDVIPLDPVCGDDPGLQYKAGYLNIAYELIETPVNGKVSDLIQSGRLLPNPASNPIVERKTVHGVLEVDEDYSFDGPGIPDIGRPKLYLGPGAKILVRSGQTLTLTNADIFTCDVLAAGIEVESGATLIATGSTLNDSRFAIDARPGSSLSLTGNRFSNNYTGLHLDMSNSAAGKRVNLLAFANNTFATTAPAIKEPYPDMPEAVENRGFCGIYLRDYQDFNTYGSTDFERLANGVLAFNATGNIGNMRFLDMRSTDATPVYPLEGFGIRLTGKAPGYWFNVNEPGTSMSFNHCKTGIRASNYALNAAYTAMDNVDVGIDVSNSPLRDIVLDHNTITARKYGIRSGLNEPLHPVSAISNNTITITELGSGVNPVAGIQINEAGFGTPPAGQSAPAPSGWDVTGNTITLQKGGHGILYRNGVEGIVEGNSINDKGLSASSGAYEGIRVDGAAFTQVNFNDITRSANAGGNADTRAIHSMAGYANGFTCNCVDNTGVGMQFFDLADFTDHVRGNNFHRHDGAGLQLGAPNIGNAYIGTQYHTGNRWDLAAIPVGGFGGINWGTTGDILDRSKFFVDPMENGGALNPPVDPEEWFKAIQTEEPSFSCENDCAAPVNRPPFSGEYDTPTALDHAIATNTLPTDGWAAETAWKGAYRLYRKLLRRPALASYAPEYAAFMAAQASLSSGRLAFIAEEKARLFALSAPEAAALEQHRLNWRSGIAALDALDRLRQAGETVDLQIYALAAGESTARQSTYAQYLNALEQTRQAKIGQLLALNAAVSTTLQPDANHKTVNDITLRLLLNSALSDADLAVLSTVAAQCPLEGGDAVYEARAMVAFYTGREYDDYSGCAIAERQQETGRQATAVARPYPNPTTGEVLLPGANGALVRVWNELGQLKQEINLTDDRLSLAHLPQGLYRLQVFTPEQPPVAHNILLIHP